MNSRFCFGPMSLNIVNALIDYANKHKQAITLIPSRRQIDWNGGYVNNWTTETFTKYVKDRSKFISIQRDHGGPSQGSVDDDGYTSLRHDCKHLDSIHIDPWKKYPNYNDALKWTIDMLNFCDKLNPNLYYEVATEEAIRPITTAELDRFLNDLSIALKPVLYKKILYCVIQSGTALMDCTNIGVYQNDKLCTMIEITKKYGKLSKEHNGDYMDSSIMNQRFKSGLTSLNIAPELGVIETDVYLDNMSTELIDAYYNICFTSNKWVKWVSDKFDVTDKIPLVRTCGHYQFSTPEFMELTYKYDYTDIINTRILKFVQGCFLN